MTWGESRIDAGRIPAHAGKTTRIIATVSAERAHPRSRGENPASPTQPPGTKGASPLTRGKPYSWRFVLTNRGRIPAHAGKTSERTEYLKRGRAHPRSRGENSRSLRAGVSRRGASPLTRGKPEPGGPRMSTNGRIPAHAGKTLGRRPTTPARRAHPRSRGENEIGGGLGAHLFGASPLTRGKHGGGRGLSRPVGRIPAHAGKTRR